VQPIEACVGCKTRDALSARNACDCSTGGRLSELISQNVFIDSFLEIQLLHNTVNLMIQLVIVNNKLTVLWGSQISQPN
jgi:hypothetical protein